MRCQSVASFRGDISSLTAPPFILSNKSLVEYSTYWSEYPDIFVAPAREPDPVRRAAAVLRWFIVTLHRQYGDRSESSGSEKKPLNPFLGELFVGHFPSPNPEVGDTQLFSEQVSHHPPVTAYAIRNDKHGMLLQGYNGQRVTFTSTFHIRQIGHAVLTLTPPATEADPRPAPESYLFTLPMMHVESLIYGTPFLEIDKSSYIASSSGLIARIDYSGKGWLSGKRNSFNAILYRNNDPAKTPLFSAHGQWSGAFKMCDHTGSGTFENSASDDNDPSAEHINIRALPPPTPLVIPPLEYQDRFESRRAWRHVASALTNGDMGATSRAKSRIENAQRQLRRLEAENGETWHRRFFRRIEVKGVGGGEPADDNFAGATEGRGRMLHRGCVTMSTDSVSNGAAAYGVNDRSCFSSDSRSVNGTTDTVAEPYSPTANFDPNIPNTVATLDRVGDIVSVHFPALASMIGFTEHIDNARSSGVWRVDGAAIAAPARPFRAGDSGRVALGAESEGEEEEGVVGGAGRVPVAGESQ